MATDPTPAPQSLIDVKPGYTSTEFWHATLTQVVAAVVGLASVFGVGNRPVGQGEQWTSSLNQIVPVVAALLAGFATTRQYVTSRTQLKTAAVQANAAVAQAANAQAAKPTN